MKNDVLKENVPPSLRLRYTSCITAAFSFTRWIALQKNTASTGFRTSWGSRPAPPCPPLGGGSPPLPRPRPHQQLGDGPRPRSQVHPAQPRPQPRQRHQAPVHLLVERVLRKLLEGEIASHHLGLHRVIYG